MIALVLFGVFGILLILGLPIALCLAGGGIAAVLMTGVHVIWCFIGLSDGNLCSNRKYHGAIYADGRI